MKKVTQSQYTWTLVWFILVATVGSILIFTAFFLFITSAAQPTSLQLMEPKETEQVEKKYAANGDAALTLILAKNDVIHYYEGQLKEDGSNIRSSTYTSIRKIIVAKKQSTDPKDFVVIIKPAEGASYKNTVDILDEMTIDSVEHYSMVDLSRKEAELIARK